MDNERPRTVVLPEMKIHCKLHPKARLVEDYRAGDMVCPVCGRVVADRVIDVGPEWRTFQDDSKSQDRSRVGMPEDPVLSGSAAALSTGIAAGKINGRYPDINYSKFQNRVSLNNDERAVLKACKELSIMCDRIGLPRNILTLFKQVHSSRLLKSRSHDAKVSACLYIACRQEGAARTIKEICALGKVSKKDIGKCFNLIKKYIETNVDLVGSDEYISRFCSLLSLHLPIQKLAAHICKRAHEMEITSGRVPISVTAASIFVASQLSQVKKSIKDVSNVTGVSETTIKAIHKVLATNIKQLLPSDYVK